MKLSFQIIHNYQSEPLKIISDALHLTLQDDLYEQIDKRTTLDYIKINFNYCLQSDDTVCFFEIDFEPSENVINNYDDFISGFVTRLKEADGFVRLVKFLDEVRIEQYIRFYKEISDIEMKVREVFSYIFYNRYNCETTDELDEYDVKYPAEKPSSNDFKQRYENPFFYFTFNGYYQFSSPKDLPVKDIIPLIQSTELYNELRNTLNSRGISKDNHNNFLSKIKEKLDSIEKVRNCIAHNRAIPNRTVDNYEIAIPELKRFITDFWDEELSEINLTNEPNFAENHSYARLKDLLSISEWNETTGKVTVKDDLPTGLTTYDFNSIDELKSFLIEESNKTFSDNLPVNDEEKQRFQENYNDVQLVEKVLKNYKKELIIMEWL